MLYYVPSTGGFWDDTFGDCPEGSVEISRETHADLLEGLYSGRIITISDGAPVLADKPETPPTIVSLKAYAAARRYTVETGGISLGGMAVLTDRESQRLIADAASYVTTYGVASIDFKAASGFVTLTAGQISAIAEAVGAHVQASFSAEMAVDAAIEDGSITTTAAIDAWAWPSNL